MNNIILLTALFLVGCASIQSLDGGDKDTVPPVVLKVSPDSASINSTLSTITFTFDEYIKTTKVSDLLLISPSQKIAPTIIVKGKKLTIIINDTLLHNTTYTIQFNGSVLDNNEGNPLLNYNYIFSTGSYIDSLVYTGHIRDLLTNKPVENCNVQLYTTINDSNILNTKPDYITRTDDKGNYNLTNLPNDSFLAIAILDINNNLLLDEEDQVSINRVIFPTQLEDTLYLFKNESSLKNKPQIQKSSPGIYILKNNKKLTSSSIYLHINKTPVNFNLSQSKDSIIAYYTPSTDTSHIQVIIDQDTSEIIKITKLSDLDYSPTLNIYNAGLSTNLKIQTPISFIDTNKIILLKDSISIPFYILQTSPVTLTLKTSNYPSKLIINQGAITDVFNKYNKSDTFNIKPIVDIKSNFRLHVNTIRSNDLIIQLMKGTTLIEQHLINKTKVFDFKNLPAAKYRVLIITDSNSNTIWDTGNTLISKSPEIIQFSKEFELRENWDKELIINVK
jgi:hypothetical protein